MTNKFSHKYLPVFLSGFIDGLIVPLALYSFFNRISEQHYLAIQITFIGGFVMAILLGVGAYFTRKAEIENTGERKLLEIYSGLGISASIQQQMAEDTISEQQKWQEEWQGAGNAALGFTPKTYAIIICTGYVAGLLLVLLNAYFWPVQNLSFLIVPVFILGLAGFLKYKIANQNPVAGMLTVCISGMIAALANWLVAGLF